MRGSVVRGKVKCAPRGGGNCLVIFEPFDYILGINAAVNEFKTNMFQNPVRPRGRPRSFDEKDALEKATRVFRSKGYDGVTVDDLVAGMGVGRPSLYAVFGDKRAIFLRVLRAYAERKGASAAKALL